MRRVYDRYVVSWRRQAQRVRRRLHRRSGRPPTIAYDDPYLGLMNQTTAGLLYWGQPYLFDIAIRELPSDDPQLVTRGLILFDDSDPLGHHPGVWPVVKLALQRGYELVEANPYHLIRKRVP